MASEDNTDSGPSVQFSWNFPLVRVVTGTLTSVGSSVNQRRPGIITENVAERITQDNDEESSDEPQEIVDADDDDSPLNDIRDRLSDLSDRDTSDLGVDGESSVVTFSGDVFVPLRSEVDVGGEVTWANNSEAGITLVFDDGEQIDLPAGETASRTFNEGGAVQFQTRSRPQDELCGAVLVGDDAPTPVLPCESSVDREIFEDGGGTVEVTTPSSMSSAADDKEKSWE